MGSLQLYENPGWGSAIVEAQLVLYGLAHDLVEVGDTFEDAEARAALEAINPLAQVPVLILPDGQVMTESAAMTLYLADLAGSEMLVPGPRAAERAAFLRWLIFLVAAVYSTFPFADAPGRFVSDDEADAFMARVIGLRCEMFKVMEAEAEVRGGPWFLGGRMTAIDIYLMVMVHWRPRKDWFAEETPQLLAIAERAAALPVLAGVMQRNFG